MKNSRAGNWRHQWPRLLGLVEGLAAALVLAFAWAWLPDWIRTACWPVLLWAALSAGRPLAYQGAALLAICLVWDVLAGQALGGTLLMAAPALVLASLAAPHLDSRWSPGHALFALGALAGAAIGMLVTPLLPFSPAAAPLSAKGLAGGLLVVAIACAVTFAVRVGRDAWLAAHPEAALRARSAT